ncbi:MAG: RluA family pseudouridine synthase [Victivallaceae bacterium]
MQIKLIKLSIDDDAHGSRLDRCLSQLIPDCSRTFLQKMIKSGKVSCNGKVLDVPRFPVQSGMEIIVELDEIESTAPTGEDIDLPIIYEDEFMLVINKPAGMVVHPAFGNPSGTVVNALLARYPYLTDIMSTTGMRPGIVHRLDKDTSGCLIAAKTPQAQFKLAKSFADRKVTKTYMAIVMGVPKNPTGKIATLIGRHPINRQKMAVVTQNGKEAITIYDIARCGLYEGVPLCIANVNILTGRTHQIRVHLASIGHPVLGDRIYGGSRLIYAPRQMLHAWKLKIPHPVSGEIREFEAPLPEDFTDIISKFTPLATNGREENSEWDDDF